MALHPATRNEFTVFEAMVMNVFSSQTVHQERQHAGGSPLPAERRGPAPVSDRRAQTARRVALQQLADNSVRHSGSGIIQRVVIPTYARSGRNAAQDKHEVDGMASKSASEPNAGAIAADFKSGGSLAGVAARENILLVGHGNIDSLNGYSGRDVADALKTRWSLPPAYAGNIRLTSCKAGDAGWFSHSLVRTISDNLRGYQATVEGLKGNVVTSPEDMPQPGLNRSLVNDDGTSLDTFNELHREYRNLIAARDRDYSMTQGSLAMLTISALETRLSMLRMQRAELLRKQGSAPVATGIMGFLSTAINAVTHAKTELEQIEDEIHAGETRLVHDKPGAEHRAQQDRHAVDQLYAQRIHAILAQIDAVAIPMFTDDRTVRDTPQDRDGRFTALLSDLSAAFIQFMEREAQPERPAAAGDDLV